MESTYKPPGASRGIAIGVTTPSLDPLACAQGLYGERIKAPRRKPGDPAAETSSGPNRIRLVTAVTVVTTGDVEFMIHSGLFPRAAPSRNLG